MQGEVRLLYICYICGFRGLGGRGARPVPRRRSRGAVDGTKCANAHCQIAAKTEEFLKMRYKPLALAAAALMAGVLSFGGAQAANVMTAGRVSASMNSMQDGNIQEVR